MKLATSIVESLERRCLLSAAADYVPGELLVGFNPGVSQADIAQFYKQHGVSEREALDRHSAPNARHLKLVSVPAARTLKFVSVLEHDPRVAYAEPNYVIANAAEGANLPSDSYLPGQFYLNNTGQSPGLTDADIDAPEAWNITTGSPDVFVAVLDSGIDYNHPELAANIWTNPGEIAGDGIDNDGNGYKDDVHGYDFVNKDGDPMDDLFHGTACAGLIGASPFNGGTVGVAWRVGIVAVKVIGADNTGTWADIARGVQYINYLKNVQGLNIVATNCSIGGTSFSQALHDAFAGADQPGMAPILHVCAAGNHGQNTDISPHYPSGFDLDNIVSVAATDWSDQYADWTSLGLPDILSTSNYGALSVDLAASGSADFTTVLGNRFNFADGTSFAAPLVTGAAALVFSAFSGITAAQVKQRILAGVDPIGQIGANNLKPTLTNGRLNVAKALAGAPQNGDRKAPAVITNLAAGATTAHSVALSWSATGDDAAIGRAAFYDVRYSNTPITKSNWDLASRVTGETTPKPAGTAETFTVSGLDPGATYYFALKVRDEIGNESGLSSVAVATTAQAVPVFADNIESGDNGWTATGLWHRSTFRANSASTAWYYGVEATRTYETGAVNHGELTSPLIDLDKGSVLIFKQWLELEDSNLDVAAVEISTGPDKWETVRIDELSTSPDTLNYQDRANFFGWDIDADSRLRTPQWVSRAIDLSAYAGKKIQVRFSFKTLDDLFNNFEGWYIDDVNIFAGAASSFATQSAGSSVLSRSSTRSIKGDNEARTRSVISLMNLLSTEFSPVDPPIA